MQRIEHHPILSTPEAPVIHIIVDGKTLEAREGDTIAAALMANGIRTFRHTHRFHEPRGIFCGIGQCTDCIMEVDGQPNIKTCVTRARDGMVIRTQEGNGGTQP